MRPFAQRDGLARRGRFAIGEVTLFVLGEVNLGGISIQRVKRGCNHESDRAHDDKHGPPP